MLLLNLNTRKIYFTKKIQIIHAKVNYLIIIFNFTVMFRDFKTLFNFNVFNFDLL